MKQNLRVIQSNRLRSSDSKVLRLSSLKKILKGKQMGFVPADAEWYVAEIIEEIRVEGEAVNVVRKNLILVRAASPDAAFARALQLGEDGAGTYQNPKGEVVTSMFRGLGYLDVLHDGLEDGAEILYQQTCSVSEEEIRGLVCSKEQLNLFQNARPDSNIPDYRSKEVLNEVNSLINRDSRDSRDSGDSEIREIRGDSGQSP